MRRRCSKCATGCNGGAMNAPACGTRGTGNQQRMWVQRRRKECARAETMHRRAVATQCRDATEVHKMHWRACAPRARHGMLGVHRRAGQRRSRDATSSQVPPATRQSNGMQSREGCYGRAGFAPGAEREYSSKGSAKRASARSCVYVAALCKGNAHCASGCNARAKRGGMPARRGKGGQAATQDPLPQPLGGKGGAVRTDRRCNAGGLR